MRGLQFTISAGMVFIGGGIILVGHIMEAGLLEIGVFSGQISLLGFSLVAAGLAGALLMTLLKKLRIWV
jgi:hypothetical protein